MSVVSKRLGETAEGIDSLMAIGELAWRGARRVRRSRDTGSSMPWKQVNVQRYD